MNLKLKMLLLSLVAVTIGATSCSNNKSYAEQLADERVAVNLFLAGQRVVNDILVKVLLNEDEATLPVESDVAPYYHWNDFKAYCQEKLASFNDI